jgi:hypothetical protein
MPEMERAEHLLKSGLEKQQISVLASLPKILASSNSKTNLLAVLDCIKVWRIRCFSLPSDSGSALSQSMWQKMEADNPSNSGSNAALQLEIFQALSHLARATVDGKVLSCPSVCFHEDFVRQLNATREDKCDAVFLLSDEQIAKQLVPLALDFVSETHQKDLAEAACATIISSLPRLAGTIKKTQIIRVAMEKGDVSQPPGSRLICCLLLGAVTAFNLLSPQDIEGLYFHKVNTGLVTSPSLPSAAT